MVTFLITSALIFGLFAIAIYFWQKPAKNAETIDLPPSMPPRGLFSDSQLPAVELPEAQNNGNAELLDRAHNGDLTVLLDAKGLAVYPELQDVFVSRASSETELLSLGSHLAQHNLPVNTTLAEILMKAWQASPGPQTTTTMLHAAALSNDAEIYCRAVEHALALWREGKLADVSPNQLLALFNGEFWLLSAEVRNSGNGFVLKRTLSSARCELEGTINN